MTDTIKELVQDLIDDLDLKIQEKETAQEQFDPVFQAAEYQFIAGEVDAYTNMQEAFCRILASKT